MSQEPHLTPQSAMSVLTPSDVWRAVRKRFWLIIACFVVFGLGGTAALVAWRVKAPLFTAEGIIEVEPGQGQTIDITRGYQGDQVPPSLFQGYVKSQVTAIRNSRVLNAALKQLEGRQDLYLGTNPVYDLNEDLVVAPIPDTQHIVVSLTGSDKQQVTEIVKAILEQYVAKLSEERAQLDTERQRDLRAKRDDFLRNLEQLSNKLANARSEGFVVVTDERGSEQVARLAALVRQLTDIQVQLADAAAAWNEFQQLHKESEENKDPSRILMAFPEIMEGIRNDRSVAALSERASALSQELLSLQQRFGERHESVKRMALAAQGSANDLEARRSEILGQLIQQQAATLKSRFDRARAMEADLQNRVAEARAAAVDASRITADYRAREAEFQRVRTLLNTIEDGLERMSIASALARPNIRVVRSPDIPVDPSEPRLPLYIPATLVFSLLLGVGLSLLLELMDTRLQTPADVVRQVGVASLAHVPDLAEDEHLSVDTNVALVSLRAPQSLIAESFRQLRTSLLFASDKPIKSLMVTSANPGDGKSTVAANLAVTMARSGCRVLLIDANFRRPTLGRLFDLPESVGLANVLVGLNKPQEAIRGTSVENLDVLVAGATPPSPGELLGSESMRQLLAEEAKAYDQVIIDGAPVLVVADIHVLAGMVDGIVVVFRAGENTRGMALRASRQVYALRGRLVGGVLNRVRATKGGYFRESFQAYYDYAGSQATSQAASALSRTAAAARPAAKAEDAPGAGDDGPDV